MHTNKPENILSFGKIYLSSDFSNLHVFSDSRKTKCRWGPIHSRLRCFYVAMCCSSGVVTDFPSFKQDFAIQIRSGQHYQCWHNGRRLHVVSVNRSSLSGAATHNARHCLTTRTWHCQWVGRQVVPVVGQLLAFSFTSPAIVRWYLTLLALVSLHASILRCFSMRCCSRFIGDTNPSRHSVQTFLSFIMWICDFVWRFRSDCVTPL